ncbi:MAG: response regulator [Acidiferrobacterales bacterium]|nr:response regulator [Acidiferrobacterales bacterium]
MASQEKPLVLVADDSRLIRKTIIKMLGDRYDIIECVDGVAAWAQIQHNSAIDIAITDIDMPNMDGYGLLCRVRASDAERLQNIPMIVITGAEDEITKERAYACGANDFILKPINADQLRTCVNDYLDGFQISSAPAVQQALAAAPSAMPDLERAIELLRSPHPEQLDAHVLNIALRVMPVLDYSNRRFGLGLDKEILNLKRKILAARQ